MEKPLCRSCKQRHWPRDGCNWSGVLDELVDKYVVPPLPQPVPVPKKSPSIIPPVDTAGLWEAIKHGDEDHQLWLAEAIDAFFSGKPVPLPRGGGRKEAEIKRLEALLEKGGCPVCEARKLKEAERVRRWRERRKA